MVNIIIVDDSKFMRVALQKLLSKYTDIDILGMFRNGIEALKFIRASTHIDVIILDCFMPKMDGIETLRNIMLINPTPTIMITIANKIEHADLYFNALRLGAFDIIPKPSGLNSLYIDQVEEILVERIALAYRSKAKLIKRKKAERRMADIKTSIKQKTPRSRYDQSIKDYTSYIYKKPDKKIRTKKRHAGWRPNFKLLVIGASTGGPPRVADLIKEIKFNPDVAILIIQHMPASFTRHFANRLNTLTEYTIKEARNGYKLKPGYGFVAPGDYHVEIRYEKGVLVLTTNQKPKMHAIRPAIDISLPSIAEIFQSNVTVSILTGMGKDGSVNLNLIKKYGGMTIAQDPTEALIDSMPVHAIKSGMVDKIMKISAISSYINNYIIPKAIVI